MNKTPQTAMPASPSGCAGWFRSCWSSPGWPSPGSADPRSAGWSEVSSNDQASFLPAGAEATEVQDWQAKFRDTNEIPAVIVIESGLRLHPGPAR